MKFNPAPSTTMHIDLNSAFATIEQQANPFLRGKPIAVAAYNSPGGCILAPSIEAKTFGVKTGMRVRDGKRLCPHLKILENDVNKYRFCHLKFRRLLSDYTNNFSPKSIDEFVLNLAGYPCLRVKTITQVAKEIKTRIKQEVGDHLTVSIGIAPNRLLAKTASGINKPDGLDIINHKNFLKIYSKLKLTDLPGISFQNQKRLMSVGINSVTDFYNSPLSILRVAFKSINSYYWFMRLRGYEVDSVDFDRKSFGNSYALPKQLNLSPILMHLTQKAVTRMVSAGYKCRGIAVSTGYWHCSKTFPEILFDFRDIYKKALDILNTRPPKQKARILFVTCFNLVKDCPSQLQLFTDVIKKENLISAVNTSNDFWGDFKIKSASTLKLEHTIHDRIAFGGVKEI